MIHVTIKRALAIIKIAEFGFTGFCNLIIIHKGAFLGPDYGWHVYLLQMVAPQSLFEALIFWIFKHISIPRVKRPAKDSHFAGDFWGVPHFD